jgi:hypothetical protein
VLTLILKSQITKERLYSEERKSFRIHEIGGRTEKQHTPKHNQTPFMWGRRTKDSSTGKAKAMGVSLNYQLLNKSLPPTSLKSIS